MGNFYNPATPSCDPCGFACDVCTSPTSCTTCQSPYVSDDSGGCICAPGYYYNSATPSCDPCSITGCSECSSLTVCTVCALGYYQPSGTSTCTLCSSNCISCDITGCLSCQLGFTKYTDSTATPPIICKDCLLLYGAQCTSCDQTTCTQCSPGYFLSGTQCQVITTVVCGDGLWVNTM